MSSLPVSLRALPFLLLGLLAACSSSADKDASGQKPMSDSMAARVMNTDMNKRSSFESSLVRSGSSSGVGKNLQKRGFATDEYAGNTRFKVPKTLQQRAFFGADDRSQIGERSFNQADRSNPLGDDTFATPTAREGSRTASQQDDVFRTSNDTYRTGLMREAARSQAENKRPVIVKPKGALEDDTPYSEDDIRRLLNRR